MGLFGGNNIPVPSSPREVVVADQAAPGEAFIVPRGYEFESVEVSELDGRQYVDVVLKSVPPPQPVVVFTAHISKDDDCDDDPFAGLGWTDPRAEDPPF